MAAVVSSPTARDEPQRPRSRMLSFGSRRSSGSNHHLERIQDSTRDKASRRITSKADPTMAINEAQPATRQLEKTTMDYLRGIEHRDALGNVITDPDQSNPTRPRLERPLDTIRSFEARIDANHERRASRMMHTPSNPHMRRSSWFPSMNGNSPRGGQEYGPGYRPRMAMSRPESYAEGFHGGYHSHSPHPGPYRRSPGPHPPRHFGPRNYSDPILHGGGSNPNFDPSTSSARHSPHQYYNSPNPNASYDASTTGSASGTSGNEAWTNSTDPSSENSSVDRIAPVGSKPDLSQSMPPPAAYSNGQDRSPDSYGYNGFGGSPIPEGEATAYMAPNYGPYGGPQRPNRDAATPNAYAQGPPSRAAGREPPPLMAVGPARTGTLRKANARGEQPLPMSNGGRIPLSPTTESGDKRKGWLKRTFSRS